MTVTVGLALVTTVGGCASDDLGGVAGESTSGSSSATGGASPRVASVPSGADLAAVTAVLRTRAAAIVSGDERAYAGSLADRSSSGGLRQLAAYRAGRALRVSHLEVGAVTVVGVGDGVGLPGGGGAPPSDGVTSSSAASTTTTTTSTAGTRSTTSSPSELRVRAPLTYRIDDLDRADRATEVSVLLRRDDAGDWSVVSETAVGAGAPPWVAMPGLTVRRGEHAVVAGTVPPTDLAEHAGVVDRALPDLRRDWSGTPDRVLVLAPGTADEADALLGRSPGSGAAPVGATTEGPTGADGRATGDRVVLDPTAYARLTTAGREVVLTHELAHVAVRASVAGRTAMWLAEGYADHIGYARADVPAQRLLAPLLTEVRAGRGPTDLPGHVELDPGSGAIQVPYLAAWQAVELLADDHGEAALRRLVVAASATGSEADAEAATDRALERVLGTTRAELTRAWQQRLRDLAR